MSLPSGPAAMRRVLFTVALNLSFLLFPASAQDAKSSQLDPFFQQGNESQIHDEPSDLSRAAQEGVGSALDFTRAFEKFLGNYPETQHKERIIRALFAASKELNDQRRIELYGRELLKTDPDDISVLPYVGHALNSFEDSKAAAKALELGRHYESLLHKSDNPPSDDETARDKGKRQFETAKNLSGALVIQADALGELGKIDQATTTAQKAFDALPSSEAARSLGHWQAKAGRFDAAVLAYANAFAIADTPENHQDDRNRMTEYYLKAHKNQTGLGDVVLTAYDRMTALNDQERQRYGNSPSSKPINFQLTTIAGNRLPLLSLKGKVIVMDFWATWCQPCRVQHPLFETVKQKFKNDDRVAFLEVDSAENRETVEPFLKQEGWTEGVYLDDGLTQALKVENLPTTVLLDRKGDLYSKMIGFRPETFIDLLTTKIRDALAAPPDAPPMPSSVN